MQDTLSFFPAPYPDEDFRSVICRYSLRTNHRDLITMNKGLFGLSTDTTPNTPRGMEHFVNKLPENCGLNIDFILQMHTLWPLVRLSLSAEQLERCTREILCGSDGQHNVCGKYMVGIIAKDVRYCPYCLRDDYDLYGECFVHRSHQIASVDVCPLHHVSLITRCSSCGGALTNYAGSPMISVPTCKCGHSLSESSDSRVDKLSAKLELYGEMMTLMKYAKEVNQDELIRRFQIALIQEGYVSQSGRVKKQSLLDAVTARVTQSKTSELESLVDLKLLGRAVRTLCQRSWNPRRLTELICVMRFLCGSVEDFMGADLFVSVELPFGHGPWECVNRICPDFSKHVIQRCDRRVTSNNYVSGIFQCPACGCTYHKRWKMNESNHKEIPPKVTTMGWLWEAQLVELHERGLTVNQIAKQMKTQPVHVAKAIDRLGTVRWSIPTDMSKGRENTCVSELQNAHAEMAATSEVQDRLGRHRQRIVDLLASRHDICRSDINKLASGAYRWLMKHDPQWLEDTLPPTRNRDNFNWSAVDEDLVSKVIATAKRLYAKNYPTRIARYTIINSLDSIDGYRLRGGQEKVPKSWAKLLEFEESKDEYLIRFVPEIVGQLLRSGYTNVTLNSVLAFRRSYRGCSNKVRNEIVRILGDMGFTDVERGMERYVSSS